MISDSWASSLKYNSCADKFANINLPEGDSLHTRGVGDRVYLCMYVIAFLGTCRKKRLSFSHFSTPVTHEFHILLLAWVAICCLIVLEWPNAHNI